MFVEFSPLQTSGIYLHVFFLQPKQTMVNTYQEMVDPHDRAYSDLVRYAEGVARAVGIKYGMAHVELKATFDEKRKRWIE